MIPSLIPGSGLFCFSAISLTRQPEALDFLLDLIRTESLDAETAIEAIVRSVPSVEVTRQLEELAAGNPRLVSALAKHRAGS
jgi:hypothetical protein